MFIKIVTVAGLATFEIYAAIPAGYAMGLSPWIILLTSVTGGLVGVFVAAFLGDKIKALIYKNKTPKTEKSKTGLVYRIWEKYGLIGLGLIGTFAVGAPVSIAVGVGFNANLHKLLFWCCIGVIARCIVFTYVGYHGAKLF
jgi:membrane protein YqaA with SNARE-associated domain